jgi:hypothetical protein
VNLVEKIARMMDKEGAYSTGYPSTNPKTKPIPFSTRQKYWQSTYECIAIDILNLISSISKDQIKEDLIEWEKYNWERLGLSKEVIRNLHDIIKEKYNKQNSKCSESGSIIE